MNNYKDFNSNEGYEEATVSRMGYQVEKSDQICEVNDENDDFMPDYDEFFEVPEYQLPEGIKVVKIADVMKAGEVYGQYGLIPRVAVDFEFPDGTMKRERLLVVANPKSVWKQLLKSALGRTTGGFKKSEIVGKHVVVNFKQKEVDGNVYSNVVEVHAVE